MFSLLKKVILGVVINLVAGIASLSIIQLTELKMSIGGFLIIFIFASVAGSVQTVIVNKYN